MIRKGLYLEVVLDINRHRVGDCRHGEFLPPMRAANADTGRDAEPLAAVPGTAAMRGPG